MQRNAADFSKLPIVLKSTLDQLKFLKECEADWSSSAQLAISDMETKHRITISTTIGRTQSTTATSVNEFRVQVAIPYPDALVSNINSWFSYDVVKVVTSASIFNPALLPENEAQLPNYGTTQLPALADFYGKEAVVEF